MNGILIIALNKQAYAISAFNLALSIKHHSPNIHITLLSDGIHGKCFSVEHYSVFDNIKEISKEDYTHGGRFCPAKAKLSMYRYTPYDKTLYLDADSICFKDVKPLFDSLSGTKFKSNVVEGYTQWTDAETFKKYFKTEQGQTTNSSWIYFENQKVLKEAEKLYLKGFPIDGLKQKWGNSLPDELFINAAIQRLGIDAKADVKVMFFDDRKDQRSISEISDQHYFMTFYGNSNSTRLSFREWYDKYLFSICSSKGIEHRFKMGSIIPHKHVNNK